jgi:uncharacterized protein
VREGFASLLRCPVCGSEKVLELQAERFDEREVREGTLHCTACRAELPVRRGVAHLMPDPPDHVRREAAGLDRFAATMRRDGWDRERVLDLPDEPDGYWAAQKISMEQLLEEADLRTGERVVDIGSNTCWATRIFARLGLQAIALDIALVEMQGLHTADWIFEAEPQFYFERVLGLMFDMPIASGSLDYVFCCQVLHHNDRQSLRRTFEEIHRVLRPGGKLLVINEQMKFPLQLKRDHGKEVAVYGGYEHVWFFHQYALDAWRAGLRRFRILEPRYHHAFAGTAYQITPETRAIDAVKIAATQVMRRGRLRRALYTGYRTMVGGDVSLSMICEKPRWR